MIGLLDALQVVATREDRYESPTNPGRQENNCYIGILFEQLNRHSHLSISLLFYPSQTTHPPIRLLSQDLISSCLLRRYSLLVLLNEVPACVAPKSALEQIYPAKGSQPKEVLILSHCPKVSLALLPS